jgi:hypothetical protein
METKKALKNPGEKVFFLRIPRLSRWRRRELNILQNPWEKRLLAQKTSHFPAQLKFGHPKHSPGTTAATLPKTVSRTP